MGADYLVSVTPRGTRNKIESSTKWDYLPPDDDPATYDPTADDYFCITAAFEASLSSPIVLFDVFSLPADGCAHIADGIRAGTAGAVSDGSFELDIQVGTSSFTMAATQENDEERLDGSNYVTGIAEDQSPYRSELAGVIGIL